MMNAQSEALAHRRPMTCFDLVLAQFEPFLQTDSSIMSQTAIFPKFESSLVCPLISEARELLSRQSVLVHVSAPAVIVGDIHGNLPDLLQILRKFPHSPVPESLVFLGDYVDRGSHSVNVMILLLAIFCKYPSYVFLLRGNHEFSHINRLYGFYDEIVNMYGDPCLWGEFQTIFTRLPLVAILDSKIFCVHGGLSPKLTSLDQITSLQLPIVSYESDSMIADLVWSDPNDRILGYGENSRGSGVSFGPNAVKAFLRSVGLNLLVRAHQCVEDGYQTFADDHGITVFSSSLYCDILRNKCGVLRVCPHGKIEGFGMLQPQEWRTPSPQLVMTIEKEMGMKRVFARAATDIPQVRPIQTPVVTQQKSRPQGFTPKKPPVCTPKKPIGSPRAKFVRRRTGFAPVLFDSKSMPDRLTRFAR
jgi:diadenosine tetraphosphatase ApaH/serine/threonine PP2A family protein phosphatase